MSSASLHCVLMTMGASVAGGVAGCGDGSHVSVMAGAVISRWSLTYRGISVLHTAFGIAVFFLLSALKPYHGHATPMFKLHGRQGLSNPLPDHQPI